MVGAWDIWECMVDTDVAWDMVVSLENEMLSYTYDTTEYFLGKKIKNQWHIDSLPCRAVMQK